MIFNCFEYLERTSKDPRIPKNSENFRSWGARGKSLLDFGICLLSFWDFWDSFEIFKKTKFREEGGGRVLPIQVRRVRAKKD